MERRRTTIAPTSWLESPQGRLSEEEPKIHGGQAAALVITVLAILMMVVM